MGFFDDLGKKVSDVGQKAVEKTQEIAESAHVNSLISQNEGRIKDVYCQIGKLYADKYGDGCDPEFAEMIASVAELERQSVAYRKQLQDIKGIRICEACGAEVTKNSAFCSSCGAAMPKADEPMNLNEFVQCQGCGAMMEKGARFCTACGHAITAPAAIPDSAEALPEAAQEAMETGACAECTDSQ